MGLDIYHFKATLTKPQKIYPGFENYFIKYGDDEHKYNGFDVGMEYFEPYIQEIDVPKIKRTLIFVKNESDMDDMKKFLYHETHFFYESNLANIDKAVMHHVVRNKMTNLHIHKLDAPKWIVIYLFELVKETGFYYEEVGYQRKGMNKRFWEHFNSNSIYQYTHKSDFENALSCVDYYWKEDSAEVVNQRKQQFKIDFIDKYESNRSWLCICY
ncbi:MAG: hypothetical protein FWC71_06935 [Defluviitaleaceae bacterium]|nr:hypothetical protein [Defluviitaleaceae bacterium]